jgi:glycosyltransferase involved in cell wall biosynthesis
MKNNVILHISNDYSGSKVYNNLCSSLDKLGIRQTVYNPVQRTLPLGKNVIDFKIENSQIIYSPILSFYTRLNFCVKINRILHDISAKVDLPKIRIIHAHTWYSDGAIAYEIYKRCNIPYIVTIRNTDLNLFFKYMLHLRKYGVDILLSASLIIFISPIYMKRFLESKTIQKYRHALKDKIEVIPNGIDDFWMDNVLERRTKLHTPVELLYMGSFTSNKNVMRLLQAVERLNLNGVKYNLKIIGSGGRKQNSILKYIKGKPFISYLGEVRDREELKKAFSNSDIFTMPSKSETFGLVYIEAISQGLPILFSINEGIDGCYDNIGEGVNPLNIKDISNGIEKITDNFNKFQFHPLDIVQNHNWIQIAKKYNELYYKFAL